MDSIPEFKIVFQLTKKDAADFDRDSVGRQLGITPSKTVGTELSKGLLAYAPSIESAEAELSGITILPASTPPYQMLKHAYWSVELPKVKSWELNKPLQKMEGIFGGKASNVRDLCDYYGLSASLIIRVFSEANGMPDLTLSNDALSFWASMNVDVKFDFYLD